MGTLAMASYHRLDLATVVRFPNDLEATDALR
jgi:hypothetical protein